MMKKTFKRITVLTLALILVLGMTVTASAASNVTYDGNAQQFIFVPGSDQSPTDLFTEFKGVMPGDELTQKIVVKNDKRGKDKAIIYVKSLGAQEGSDDFLSQMNLKVKAVGGDTELFDAAANETAQLTDWVCLGELNPGAEVTLDVTLNIPITMGNDFQQQIGYLDWQFKVEQISVEEETTGDDFGPEDESKEPSSSTEPELNETEESTGEPGPGPEVTDPTADDIVDDDKTKDDGTQTGDDSNMTTYIVIALCALAVAILALARRKKTEE